MKNEELNDLITSIHLTVKEDVQMGNNKQTIYTLPNQALSAPIIEAIEGNFSHFKSCIIQGNILKLEHPDSID